MIAKHRVCLSDCKDDQISIVISCPRCSSDKHYQHTDICFSENGVLCVPRSQPPQGDWYLCCTLPQRVRGSTAVRMSLTFHAFILGLLGLVLRVQRKLCNGFGPFEASLPALESVPSKGSLWTRSPLWSLLRFPSCSGQGGVPLLVWTTQENMGAHLSSHGALAP